MNSIMSQIKQSKGEALSPQAALRKAQSEVVWSPRAQAMDRKLSSTSQGE